MQMKFGLFLSHMDKIPFTSLFPLRKIPLLFSFCFYTFYFEIILDEQKCCNYSTGSYCNPSRSCL